MILKSVSRKNINTTGQLLEYILKEKQLDKVPEHLIWTQNLLGTTIKEIEREFIENEANRISKGANRNALYHEWVSISRDDKSRVNESMLKEIAYKYFELRNSNALMVACPHFEKSHQHIHFAISGTEINGKSLRISKQEFNQLKKDLQEWHIQRFPELQNSIIDFDKKSKNFITDKEYKVIEREGKSGKQILKEKLEEIFKSSISKEDFIQKIHDAGLNTYVRGQNMGITMESGRNLRFKNLGFGDERIKELEKIAENLKSITSVREKQQSGRKLNRENLVKEVEEYRNTPESAKPSEELENEVIAHSTDEQDNEDETEQDNHVTIQPENDKEEIIVRDLDIANMKEDKNEKLQRKVGNNEKDMEW